MPHSEIPGSKPVCGSPELIAAYHVLHRHLAPRHSPYALSSLTINIENSCRRSESLLRRFERHEPFSALQFRHAEAPGGSAGGRDLVFCGRKKLPFAGYSVVKELVEASSRPALRRPAASRVRLRPCGLRRDQLLSNLSTHSRPPTFPPGAPGSCAGTFYLTLLACPMQAEASQSSIRFNSRRQSLTSRPCPPSRRRDLHAAGSGGRRLVENTGLEPVTSWLQTRRSPS